VNSSLIAIIRATATKLEYLSNISVAPEFVEENDPKEPIKTTTTDLVNFMTDV
jgi:hypothetical protein